MSNIAYFLILVSVTDDTTIDEISSECDYSITHPSIIDTEIVGLEDCRKGEAIKVKLKFDQEVTEEFVAGVFESRECVWNIKHDSIDTEKSTLLSFQMK